MWKTMIAVLVVLGLAGGAYQFRLKTSLTSARSSVETPLPVRSKTSEASQSGQLTQSREEGADIHKKWADDLLQEEGLDCLAASRFNDCIRLYESILEKVPDHADVLLKLADLYAKKMKLPERAIPYLEKLMTIGGRDYVVERLVDCYKRTGREKAGLDFFSANVDPPNQLHLAGGNAFGAAELLAASQLYEEAINKYEQASSGDRYQVIALDRVAKLHQKAGDSAQAIDAYTRAIANADRRVREADPDYATVLDEISQQETLRLALIELYLSTGDVQSARAVVRDAANEKLLVEKIKSWPIK